MRAVRSSHSTRWLSAVRLSCTCSALSLRPDTKRLTLGTTHGLQLLRKKRASVTSTLESEKRVLRGRWLFTARLNQQEPNSWLLPP